VVNFESIRASAMDLVARSEHLVLSTLDDHGSPDARMLFNLRHHRRGAFLKAPVALESHWDTWVATNTSSRKIRELRADARCCLYYFDTNRFEGLTLQGVMEDVEDIEVRNAIWQPAWEMFYPGGLEGGDFSVLRFHALQGRWYHGMSVCEFHADTMI